MTHRSCSIAGCTRQIPQRSYSRLCDTHRTAEARHGHPTTRHLTAYELAPWLRIVRDTRKRNPDSAAWEVLEKRLDRVRDHCAAIVADYERGQPTHRPTRQAAQAVLQVTSSASAWVILETLLAVAVMREQCPNRWPSDRAYRFALVRRFRGFAPMAVGKSWNNQRRQVRGVYRCMPQKATDILGQFLVDLLGIAGVMVNEAEARRLAAPKEEDSRLHAALEGLQ